mmetsp:Transcript_19793/g.26102  ORF Transcript_19793/g.26102 Transcript_19793/m.26102 type:complete len:98 (+) Transcript_19793:10-303(+)
MIYDLNISFLKTLQSKVNVFLKKWSGIFAKSDPGILYRPHGMFGLNLTSLSGQFQKLQVSKCLLLKNSADGEIQCLYNYKMEMDKKIQEMESYKTDI